MAFFLYKMNVVIQEQIVKSGTLEKIGFLNPLNVQWRRRYYEFGNFEIQMLASEYNSEALFVENTNTGDIGIIQKVSYSSKANGEFITISGYFYEFELCNKSQYVWEKPPASAFVSGNIYPKTIKGFIQYHMIDNSASSTSAMNTAFLAGYNDISWLENERIPYVINTDFDFDNIPNGNVSLTEDVTDLNEWGIVLQKILRDNENGLKTRITSNNRFLISAFKGKDRTQDQNTNTYCVFSDAIGNIKNVEYSNDISNFKNSVLCGASYVRESNSSHHVSHYTSSSVYTYTSNYLNNMMKEAYTEVEVPEGFSSLGEDEKDNLLKSQAPLYLLNYLTIENVSFDVIDGFYEYGKDYDLGDKVDVVINSLKKSYSYRIIGIDEIYKENVRTLKLYLGDMKKKIYQKGRY